MSEQQLAKRRQYFFIGCTVLTTVITLVSASATFKINERSFADWKEFDSGLAFLATVGVEATFTLALFGFAYVLTGRIEKGIGGALLIGTIAVMAINYITHHKMTTHARLSDWQLDYVQFIGPLSLFGILTMIVGIVMFNHEARERRLDREYAYAAKLKAFEWRQAQLESRDFERHMEQYRPQVYEEARQSLNLPALPPRRAAGFAMDDNDPKGQSDLD